MLTFRRAGTASAALLPALAVTLGLSRATTPEWVRQAGLDVWNSQAAWSNLGANREEADRLREQAERLHRSIEAVDHLSARLAEGTVSLAEATDATEPLVRDRPGFSYAAGLYYAAPTFRLSVARYLIDRVRRVLAGDPGRLAAAVRRLGAEYTAMSLRAASDPGITS